MLMIVIEFNIVFFFYSNKVEQSSFLYFKKISLAKLLNYSNGCLSDIRIMSLRYPNK